MMFMEPYQEEKCWTFALEVDGLIREEIRLDDYHPDWTCREIVESLFLGKGDDLADTPDDASVMLKVIDPEGQDCGAIWTTTLGHVRDYTGYYDRKLFAVRQMIAEKKALQKL